MSFDRNNPTASPAPPGDTPAKPKGGHGGTSIQKVEIVVTCDQSPSKIARALAEMLKNLPDKDPA